MGFMRHLQWGPVRLSSRFGPYGFVDGIFPFYHLTAFLSVAVRAGHRLGPGGAARFCAAPVLEPARRRCGDVGGAYDRHQLYGLFGRRRRHRARAGAGGAGTGRRTAPG